MSTEASVIVVNWNGSRFLTPCLSALRAQTHPSYHVILVDNGSTDDSVALVRRDFPEVTVIQNDANLGFAAANNVGIRASRGEYIATVNNDTRVEPGWLAELTRSMDAHPSVGMCASKQLLTASPGTIDSAGICVDRAGLAWDRLGGEPDDARSDSPQEVFGPCAAAALYRRTMLDQIGLFDESFFAYMEDVDLAWRARLAGWKCLYVPTARVYHTHSATGGEGSPFKLRLLGRNTVWTIVKNYPWPHCLIYSPVILAYQVLAVIYTLTLRRELNPLKGRLDALRGLRSLLKKRKAVQARRVISSREMLAQLTPLENPREVFARYRHLRRATAARS